MKGTNKLKDHIKSELICLNSHRGLCQSDENKCVLTHSKDGATLHFRVRATRRRNRKKRGVDWMEGKLKGNFLRVILGLCLEERMN